MRSNIENSQKGYTGRDFSRQVIRSGENDTDELVYLGMDKIYIKISKELSRKANLPKQDKPKEDPSYVFDKLTTLDQEH